jgi:endonuclease YncB( thermonuclease family)
MLACAAAMMLTAACDRRPGLFADMGSPAPAPAPTIAVLQSDVLIVNGQPVRLADAVTPQPSPDARCPAEALAARQTALELKTLVRGVHTATLTPTGAKDSDNRLYVHVLLDGVDPAHELIEEGLAVGPGAAAFNWCGPLSAGFPRAEHIAMLSVSGT